MLSLVLHTRWHARSRSDLRVVGISMIALAHLTGDVENTWMGIVLITTFDAAMFLKAKLGMRAMMTRRDRWKLLLRGNMRVVKLMHVLRSFLLISL